MLWNRDLAHPLVFSPTQMFPYFRSMEAFFDLSLPKSWADLSRPATPLFLPPTCHRQAYGGNPNAVPVPMGKRPRSLPFVRRRLPRPTWQAASHVDFASVRLRHHLP